MLFLVSKEVPNLGWKVYSWTDFNAQLLINIIVVKENLEKENIQKTTKITDLKPSSQFSNSSSYKLIFAKWNWN